MYKYVTLHINHTCLVKILVALKEKITLKPFQDKCINIERCIKYHEKAENY